MFCSFCQKKVKVLVSISVILFSILFINVISATVSPWDYTTTTSSSSNVTNYSDYTNCWTTAEGVKCDVADITYDEISGGDINDLGYYGYFNGLGGVVGGLAMDGDPWWLGGVDLQLDQNLTVDGNSYLSDTFPRTTLTYSLGSGALRWLNLYVQNINAEEIETYNIDVLENITVDGYINGINISNLSGTYVPYEGATRDVDIGSEDFYATDGDFSGDMVVGDDLEVTDDTSLLDRLYAYGESFFYDVFTVYSQAIFNTSITLSRTGDSILEIETTSTNGSAELHMLADGNNDLYFYTYSSNRTGTLYGLPKANSSYVDAQGERLVIGTFNTAPLYLATSRDPRFILTADGDLIPYDDKYYDIGNATQRLRDLYILGEDSEGGLHFVEDDGSYGNLSMDDDFNLLWNGNIIGNSSFNSTFISDNYLEIDGGNANQNIDIGENNLSVGTILIDGGDNQRVFTYSPYPDYYISFSDTTRAGIGGNTPTGISWFLSSSPAFFSSWINGTLNVYGDLFGEDITSTTDQFCNSTDCYTLEDLLNNTQLDASNYYNTTDTYNQTEVDSLVAGAGLWTNASGKITPSLEQDVNITNNLNVVKNLTVSEHHIVYYEDGIVYHMTY